MMKNMIFTPHPRKNRFRGFTLIELSIVLVIIGLIVGGVLVGQNLIAAAGARATITQVEKFNTAVNTFCSKTGYLPGDIPGSVASQFGFTVAADRASNGPGLGNGDGIVDGYNFQASQFYPVAHTGGEQQWLWEDLSTNSNLIEGQFSKGTATGNTGSCCAGAVSGTVLNTLLPTAKIGAGEYFSVNEDSGINYFTLSMIANVGNGYADTNSGTGLTVQQAYAIDTKTDDGLPQSGRVIAKYANAGLTYYVLSWAAGGGVAGTAPGSAASASSTTCYDNGGNASNTMTYSMTTLNGTGVNCALSFRFQ